MQDCTAAACGPQFLLLAVMLDSLGALLTVLFPVTGMAGSPFARTVAAHLPVFRIGRDLLSVVDGASLSLTLGSAADCLAAWNFDCWKTS